MTRPHCPGQDMQFWKPEDIFETPCPFCGNPVEFFKDDPALDCPTCHQNVANPKIDRSCAQWCPSADECLAPQDEHSKESIEICGRITERMKSTFGDDQRRMAHSLNVLKYADRILNEEKGLSILVVRAAAILHDIGIQAAERKYNSSAGKYQEIEGPPIAKAILEDLGVAQNEVDHICQIIANHHSAKNIDTPEFRVVWDADWLVNIPDEFDLTDRPRIRRLIERVFKTGTGKRIALETFDLV